MNFVSNHQSIMSPETTIIATNLISGSDKDGEQF